MTEPEATFLKSATSPDSTPPVRASAPWLKVVVVAAASALAGGLAAAWFYRTTLKTLQQAGATPENSDFGIHRDGPDNDT
jgi:hypothetical protein